ncbi:hypothetical protein EWB00_000568 [Schistosoma japonicum]|uniref:Uncharacterized protein n=3 Tax=Schistosoma japonicum TaxID=6182 RepID=A0A4Z2DJ92_SCHJA|nr:hypothetical protein EWB00_000568 [Schistosoma japonicum]
MSGSGPHISITFRKSKKPRLNDSVKIVRNRGLLNTSRRLLQKSINQSINSATSLRTNNASLAKKLAELQIELNNQKLAAQQANIELLKCRMELARLQAYKQAKDRMKSLILNVHESLCSQIEMGMSVMNYVKESMSLLDKDDSLDQLINPMPSILGETTIDLDTFDSVTRKEFKKPVLLTTEQNVCQRPIIHPEIQPSSSTSLVTGRPAKFVLSPRNQNDVNDSNNKDCDITLKVQTIPLIESSNTDTLSSSELIHKEPSTIVVVPPSSQQVSEQVLPEILINSPITCIPQNDITSAKHLPTIDIIDRDNDDGDYVNNHHSHSLIHSSDQHLQHISASSHIALNKSPVTNSKNSCHHPVVAAVINISNDSNKNKQDMNTVDGDHETKPTRPHLVRQARLNSKPIIDTSSFMEPVVKTKKKKKTIKRRLIRARESDDEEEDNNANDKDDKLKNNLGCSRVIETCFRRPGQFVFRVDSRNINPSTNASDNQQINEAARSKSALPPPPPQKTTNQQPRSRSRPSTKSHTTATTTIYSNNKSSEEANVKGVKKLSTLIGAENKTVNVFDLSMNQTANLSVLPPTLNDLRIKHKEQQRQPVNSRTEAQKTTTIQFVKRSILGELQHQQPQNEKLHSLVKNFENTSEHRRLSVVLTPISNENQCMYDMEMTKNNQRKFRRLYIHDQENDNNNVDIDDASGKQLRYDKLTPCINNNNNLPLTRTKETSRSRKKNL